MKNDIISKVMKFKTLNSKWITKKEILEKRKKNLEKLFNLTDKFISQITNNTTMQEREIIRLYNFYWLSIVMSYKMNLDYANID